MSRKWPYVVGGVFICCVAGFVGCSALVVGAANEVSKDRSVHYEVTGTGKPSVSFYQRGGSGQEGDVTLPWSKDVTVDGFGSGFLSVTLGSDGGKVTCKVTDSQGKVVTNTASGVFASATCSNT